MSGETWSYTNWNSGEPNNSGNEDYLTIGTTGGWNDWSSTGTAYYIVEWNTDPNLPADPANLRATLISDTRMDLAWDDMSTSETNFELEKAVASASFTQIAQPLANATTYTDTAVSAETTYHYRIRAVSASGNSGWSNTLDVTSAPPPATNLTATAQTARSVLVSWNDNSAAETGFEVERGNGSPGQGFALVATQPPNSTSYLDTAVVPEKTYSYRVRVAGAGGKSAYTAEAPVTTPLAAPTSVQIEGTSDTEVTLAWDDNSTSETGFEIVRGAGCPALTFAPLATTGTNVTAFVDDTVLPEHSYTYRIRAVQASGTSAWALDKCITTPPFAPAAPVATSLSAGRVRLTWADVSKIETGYEVMRALASNGVFERIGLVAPNVTQFVDTTAGQETAYLYRVAAVGDNGRSGWAVAAEVDTDAMLVVRKASIVRSKKASVRSKLTITGEFDVGGRGVDIGAAASFGIGDSTIQTAPPTHKGATYSFVASGVKLTLKPAAASSRVAFTLQTDDSVVVLPAADDPLTVSYTNGAFRAVGTVQLSADAFAPPARGAFVDPLFNLVSIVAALKTGAKDALTLKGVFHPTDGTPAGAPDFHLEFGSYTLDALGSDFTRSGNKWTYFDRSLGTTSIVLDYAKGTLAVAVRGTELGTHGGLQEPVHVAVDFGDVHFADTPTMTSNGKSVKY
jgi:fibronectin type 3 domain-containing protein